MTFGIQPMVPTGRKRQPRQHVQLSQDPLAPDLQRPALADACRQQVGPGEPHDQPADRERAEEPRWARILPAVVRVVGEAALDAAP